MQERPETLLSRADYVEDIKIRWQIHQYEWNKLCEDLNKAYEFILPIINKYRDYTVAAYQKQFGGPVK